MDAQDYVDKIAQRRGSVLEFHKVMAQHDIDVLVAIDNLTRAAMLSERDLDAKTRELLVIVALAALRGDRADLAGHIRIAGALGLSPQAILQALEILVPLGGVVLFKEAMDVWREVTGATGLEPTGQPAGTGTG